MADKKFVVFDAHCDTISKIFETGESLEKNNLHVSLERLGKYRSFVQFFAVWLDDCYASQSPYMLQSSWENQGCYANQSPYALQSPFENQSPFGWTAKMLENFYRELEKSSLPTRMILWGSDLDLVLGQNEIGCLLSIEGSEAFEGDLRLLRALHRLGVRAVTLVWNRDNEAAYSIASSDKSGGLTPFGREVICEMERLHMLADVSHLSIKGFWDVMECSSMPVIASHSNSLYASAHPRNLSDDQFLALAQKGGVAGINLCSDFLNMEQQASMNDILCSADHFLSLGGEDTVCFGADLDGVELLPKGIHSAGDYDKIIEAFGKAGYSDALIEKILYKNLYRVIKQVLK